MQRQDVAPFKRYMFGRGAPSRLAILSPVPVSCVAALQKASCWRGAGCDSFGTWFRDHPDAVEKSRCALVLGSTWLFFRHIAKHLFSAFGTLIGTADDRRSDRFDLMGKFYNEFCTQCLDPGGSFSDGRHLVPTNCGHGDTSLAGNALSVNVAAKGATYSSRWWSPVAGQGIR